jgi:hypothetical protein
VIKPRLMSVALAGPLLLHTPAHALPPAPAADLTFREFYQRPIGPRGLEPTAKLIGLDGQRVRLLGYMAKQSEATAGVFILAPLPVTMGDEDESYADDLPAAAVYVHLAGLGAAMTPAYRPGLLAVSGTLQIGAADEPDGRKSMVRLVLDEAAEASSSAPAAEATPPATAAR